MTDTPPPAPPPAAGNWFEGIPAEELTYAQNRGYDKLSAKDALLQSMKSHREAEKLIGVPPVQLLHMPKDAADADGWLRFDTRMNVPTDGKYDFSSVKFTDGTEIEDGLKTVLSAALKSNHISKDAAPAIMKSLVTYMESADKGETEAAANLLDVNRTELKADWGPRFTPNMLMAKNVCNVLGLDANFVNQLEKAQGYVKTMNTLVDLAHKLGEDKFVGGGPNGETAYTKEGAQAALDAKMADNDWVKRYQNGDAACVKEFQMLTSIIVGS